MGKIRINVIGDEALEQKQKEETKKRHEAKNIAKKLTKETLEEGEKVSSETDKTVKKNKMQKKTKVKEKSPRYTSNVQLRDKSKVYPIKEALSILSHMQKAKFDETIELHINTIEKGISGQVVLPYGTGKKTRVAIISPSKNPKGTEELLKNIEKGTIDFDVLLATPDAMPRLAKVARILGPKGLMPNPKNGTVTLKPEEIAQKYSDGQINFKSEAKANVIHVAVGKMSFGDEKITENIKTFIHAIEAGKIKNIYLKSTMSPSIRIAI
jgi:large subunit ribosomal protein L1